MTKPETPEQWNEWSAKDVMLWKEDIIFLRPRRRRPKEGVLCYKNKTGKVMVFHTMWNPFHSLYDCHELEMKIKKMGLGVKYAKALVDGQLLLKDCYLILKWSDCLTYFSATAPQRLEAMYQTLNQGGKP